jgi:hypothetical protein
MTSRRSPGRGWDLRDLIALRPCTSRGNICPAMRIPLSRRRPRSARDYGSQADTRTSVWRRLSWPLGAGQALEPL